MYLRLAAPGSRDAQQDQGPPEAQQRTVAERHDSASGDGLPIDPGPVAAERVKDLEPPGGAADLGVAMADERVIIEAQPRVGVAADQPWPFPVQGSGLAD